MNKFWMVYVEGSPGTSYVHLDFGEARLEAARLAVQPKIREKESLS